MRDGSLGLRLIPDSKKKGEHRSSEQVSSKPPAGSLLPRTLHLGGIFPPDPEGGERGHGDGGRLRECGLLGISGATLSPRGASGEAASHMDKQDEPVIWERKACFVRVENPKILRKGSGRQVDGDPTECRWDNLSINQDYNCNGSRHIKYKHAYNPQVQDDKNKDSSLVNLGKMMGKQLFILKTGKYREESSVYSVFLV